MTKENDVWRNLVAPYRLAVETEKILGEDTILKPLFRKCARHIDIITDPPGAKVYIKEYTRPDTSLVIPWCNTTRQFQGSYRDIPLEI